jgi:type II secretory pathway pseudopilin PulG
MNSSRHTQFTLIEILLALMVVAVGIVAVVTLMPIGLTKNKESIGTRSAADTADQFLHAMAAEANVNWDTIKCFPDALPALSEEDIVWSEETILPDSNAQIFFSAVNASDHFDPCAHQDGVFKAVQRTEANLEDFAGIIRAWKEVVITESKAERYVNKRMGDIVPLGILDAANGTDPENYGFERGREYTLKESGGGSFTPGNYGPLALGASGAATFEGNIVNGFNSLSVGDTVPTETGNMAGPTVSGVNARLPHTPYVRIAVITPFGKGKNSVTVLAFLAFELKACGSTGTGASIQAEYVGPASGGGGGDGQLIDLTGNPSYVVDLKAEVSWPAGLPYHQRDKEIYSLKLYKGGNVGLLRPEPE